MKKLGKNKTFWAWFQPSTRTCECKKHWATLIIRDIKKDTIGYYVRNCAVIKFGNKIYNPKFYEVFQFQTLADNWYRYKLTNFEVDNVIFRDKTDRVQEQLFELGYKWEGEVVTTLSLTCKNLMNKMKVDDCVKSAIKHIEKIKKQKK